jgi:hypothetical protein
MIYFPLGDNAPGSGAHDEYTIGQEGGLAQIMRD